MRISIHFDGATTDAVRRLAVALHQVGLTEQLAVQCDGPELWRGHTPKMRPNPGARVAGQLINHHGRPLTQVRDELPGPAVADDVSAATR